MKLIFVVACFFALTLAAPNPNSVDPDVSAQRALPAILHDDVRDERGQYFLHYITAEGIEVTEKGKLVPTPDGTAYVLVVEGETKFKGDDGEVYVTKYSAGLDGTQVTGDHLPVPVVAEPVPVGADPVPVVADPVSSAAESVPAVAEPLPATAEPVQVKIDPEPEVNQVTPVIADPTSTTTVPVADK